MKVKIFKSLIIISLAAIFILPQMVFAVDNAVDKVPAQRLLFPYFQYTLPFGTDTLIYINNLSWSNPYTVQISFFNTTGTAVFNHNAYIEASATYGFNVRELVQLESSDSFFQTSSGTYEGYIVVNVVSSYNSSAYPQVIMGGDDAASGLNFPSSTKNVLTGSEIIVNVSGQYAGEFKCVNIEATANPHTFEYAATVWVSFPYLQESQVGAVTSLILWFGSLNPSREISFYLYARDGTYTQSTYAVPNAVNVINLSDLYPGVGSGVYNYGWIDVGESTWTDLLVGQALIVAEGNAFEIVQSGTNW